MRLIITLLCLLGIFYTTQLNAQFHISSGASVTVNGSAALVLQDVDFDNQGTFNAGTGTVKFTGSADNTIHTNGDDFNHVELDKATNGDLRLLDDMTVNGTFTFGATGGNLVEVDQHDLIFGTSGAVSGYDASSYVMTDSTGYVIKKALTTFTYPVGADDMTYNPLTLVESGTVDTVGVRVMPDVKEDGTSGAILTNDVVAAAWEVTEETPGGANIDMTAQWAGSDELSGFDRSNCGISRYDASSGWDLVLANLGNSAGTDPYTRIRSGIMETGIFGVASDALLHELTLGVDMLLEGAYNSGGEMTDILRTSGNFSLTEPFTGLGFTHLGGGGGETIAASVLSTTGNDAIVDWIFVEIRTGTANGTKVATRSALLQKDGDIVDLDGTSDLKFAGFADDNYYVVVRHRNHLGVLSNTALALSNTATSLDFKTTDANVTGGGLSLTDLGGGFYGFVSGDFDVNGQVQNTDNTSLVPTIGLSGYLQGDLDLNNQVQNTDLQIYLIPNIGKGAQFTY